MDPRWIVFGLLAAVLAAGYALGVRALHKHTIYPFTQQPFAEPGYTPTEIAVPGTEGLTAYVHRAVEPDAPVILFFMGNAGALAVHSQFLENHRAAGRSVIGMGYRGGGGLPGSPSETGLKADALMLFDNISGLVGNEHGPVLVHGYSLGSGLALHVAANRPVQGVILDAPFARACDLFFRSYGITACWFPFFQKWDSLPDASVVTAPVLINHGDMDRAVPIAEAMRLADSLRPGAAVTFDPMPGRSHIDVPVDPAYEPGIARFIASLSRP
jgi:hypothetical protein